MTQKLKAQLTILINLLLLVFFATSVFFIGNAWQQQRERETREQEQQRYFVQVEGYLQEITSFISSISNHYTGDCPRRFVLLMRKELFSIPGAIEFGVIEKDGDRGVVVCNSWGDDDRVEVRVPKPHDGFLITGPHTINSLEMPIFVIKKSIENFEFNVIIKKSSVDVFFNNSSHMTVSGDETSMGERYRTSEVLDNLAYYVSPLSTDKKYHEYFIPITLLLFIIAYFLFTPQLIRAIDKIMLRRRIKNHYYYNEYQPVVDTNQDKVFSIEVFLRSRDDVNVKDTIAKMKSLDLSIDHTIFQIRQIELNFSKDFIAQNNFQVNISSLHLKSVFFVDHILQLEDLTCSSLILEVTEDENLMLEKQTIKEHMKILKALGCRFAIDDFGIEYSGLSYISEFDFDIVKTDKIFMGKSDQNTAILKSIIAFCNELNIDCIAEGIETEKDKDETKRIGIHLHQGWYHGCPMSAEKIVAYRGSM